MANNGVLIVREDTAIKGDIRNCRQIEIYGYVEGDLAAQMLLIHRGGKFRGRAKTENAEVHGTLEGDVVVKHLINIRTSGTVVGNVRYGQLEMELGASLSAEVKNVPPSSFGFAVAVHPEDPDMAWFVPAIKDERRVPVDGRVVVTRTRDGGQTFEVLSRGLPQEHAYDLTFRHGLDVDETGRRLAFGSTTGSCWISEDQGDSWRCLAEHLPPIYCVRFA